MFQRLSYYISVSVDADDSAAIDATVAMTANDLIIVSGCPLGTPPSNEGGGRGRAGGRAVLLFRDLTLSGEIQR